MSNLFLSVYVCLRAVLKERRDLALENLALRQQLAVLKRSHTKLKIKGTSRRISWRSARRAERLAIPFGAGYRRSSDAHQACGSRPAPCNGRACIATGAL